MKAAIITSSDSGYADRLLKILLLSYAHDYTGRKTYASSH